MPFFRLIFNILIIMIIVRGLTFIFAKISQMIQTKKAKKRYAKMEEQKKNGTYKDPKEDVPTEIVEEQKSNIEVKHFGRSKKNKNIKTDVSDITFESEEKPKTSQQTKQTNPNQPVVEE